MLTAVEISNYRGFKTYRMEGLGRVNLLVGKNNCGKTALLEAVHLLASGGNPLVLAEATERRGETIVSGEDRYAYPDLTHFFYGHELRDGAWFSLRSDDGYPKLTVRVTTGTEPSSQPELFDTESERRPVFGVVFDGAASPWSREKVLPVSQKGGLVLDSRLRYTHPAAGWSDSRPTIFIPPGSLSPAHLAELWSQVILEARQDAVVAALRIIEADLCQIIFLPGSYGYRPADAPSGIVALTSSSRLPIPLGSMGDGMRRLLALACALVRARNGVLLVDEIDTGVHYSVMADMWALVVEAAVSNNLQVFAATHSLDCVNGLAAICQREPKLMEHVAVHKIDSALNESVPFRGESLVRAVEGGIELR